MNREEDAMVTVEKDVKGRGKGGVRVNQGEELKEEERRKTRSWG